MARITWPDKYPNEVLTNSVDWSQRLGDGITITARDFEVLEGDVTLGSSGTTDPHTFVQVLGGTGTGIATVRCEVTLSNGDVWEDVAEFRMLEYPV